MYLYSKQGLAFRAVRTIFRHMKNTDQAAKQMSTQTNVKVLPVTSLTDDERAVQETVSRFANERVAPLAREMENKKKIDPTLIEEMFKAGLMGLAIPEKYGGSENSLTCKVIITEELSKIDAGIVALLSAHNFLACQMIALAGSEEVKQAYLPRLAKNEIASFCLSEATSGSDAFAMKTRAKADGDDYLLNGSKLWITNADLANVFVVFANADPSKGHRGISAFVVERSMPGVTVGPPEDKLGLTCSGTCPIHFDNVRIPKMNVLGELYQGSNYITKCLNDGRILVGAKMNGMMQGCFNIAVKYTLERKQFGQPVYDFQGLQHEIARIAIKMEAARVLVYNTVKMFEAGQSTAKEAAMIKYYTSELAQEVTRKCIDWMGGVGFTKAFLVEKFYRDCKAGTIYDGTSLIQLATIARMLKKEYLQ